VAAGLLALLIGTLDGALLVRYLRIPARPESPRSGQASGISVIVPVYNAAATLRQTLEAILASEGVAPEIIVADDGSTDGTATVAKGLGGVRVITLPHRGKWAALNAGIAEASHPLVATIDADTCVELPTLYRLSAALERHDAVAGALHVANTGSVLGGIQAQEHLRIAVYRRIHGTVDTVSGPVAAFRREVVRAVPFRDSEVEDYDHTLALRSAGASIGYVPGARAYTVMPDGLRPYLRQRARWARGTVRAMHEHGLGMSGLRKGAAIALCDVLVVPLCLAAGLYMPLVGLTVLEGIIQVLATRREGLRSYAGAPAFFVHLVFLAAVALSMTAYGWVSYRQYHNTRTRARPDAL